MSPEVARSAQPRHRTTPGHLGRENVHRQGCNPNSRPGCQGRGHQRRRCPSDTYPLPVPPQDDWARMDRRSCRAVTRRITRRRARGRLTSEIVGALNDLWCGLGDGGAFAHARESQAQEQVLSRVEEAVGRFGAPPPEMTGPGARAALRVCAPGGYESDAQGTRAV